MKYYVNKFPSPLEVLGGFLRYTITCIESKYWVSVPSRGMGSFLQKINLRNASLDVGFRPLARYGWVPTWKDWFGNKTMCWPFPAPREDWVVSYKLSQTSHPTEISRFWPLSRYGWNPTLKKHKWLIWTTFRFSTPRKVRVGYYIWVWRRLASA